METHLLTLYSSPTLRSRIFLWARWHLTPYWRMASQLPKMGKILDLGCGHGLLSMALALQSPEREVLGIDHDESRIQLAKKAGALLPHLRFEKGSLLQLPESLFDGIALIDVLHYFSAAEQSAILKDCYDRLQPGGTLIFREVNPSGGLVSRWNRVYEKLATASGFTRSESKTSHHFRTPDEWLSLVKKIGFSVRAERCSSILFADILFVGKK